MSPDASPHERAFTLPDRPVRRAFTIVLLFALFGPLVALTVTSLLIAFFAMVGSDVGLDVVVADHLSDSGEPGLVQLYFWPLLAVLPALALGGFFGWHQGWRGPVPLVGAVLAGAGVGAIFFLISEFLGWAAGSYGAGFSLVVGGLSTLVLYPLLGLLARNDPEALEATHR